MSIGKTRFSLWYWYVGVEVMGKGDGLLDRLIGFGVAVLEFSESMPKTTAARHMADQLVRSATAGAPNYAEARSGESLRDFVHKLLCRIISVSKRTAEDRLKRTQVGPSQLSAQNSELRILNSWRRKRHVRGGWGSRRTLIVVTFPSKQHGGHR